MLNKPNNYNGIDEDLVIAWKYCEKNELYQKDLKSRIIHLKSLLDRYDLNYTGINVELPINKPYDCNTRNAKKAWIYSDVLERQNRKLEKYLMDLNKHLSDYGMNHPEIMNDPGII